MLKEISARSEWTRLFDPVKLVTSTAGPALSVVVMHDLVLHVLAWIAKITGRASTF